VNILFIGDIFGAAGRAIVADHLADIRSAQAIDLVIANAENSAGGFGVTPRTADELFALGIDVLTGGNHSFDKREVYEYMATHPKLLRPANYPPGVPGAGMTVVEARTGARCAVLNLQGRTYMPNTDCPFRKADELLESVADIPVRFVDFHAEVTSEKVAMGWHLDGRVSAVIGTHTHIPTADTRVLPGGTAYQTDAGMTGPYNSVIGVEKEMIVKRFMNSLPVRMEPAKGLVEFHSVIIDVDETTGKARAIRRHTVRGD
jgi:metallophosphoesterase (TIGR00282 family)